MVIAPGVGLFFITICVIFLALRFWAMAISKRRLYPDDGFIVFAFANTIASNGVTIWATCHGLGKHTNEVAFSDHVVQYKRLIAGSITWIFSTVFTKLSALWFYTRIFSVRGFKRWAYGRLMALSVLHGLT
ncbi:hypothetical protein HRG_014462 [Hirsutella rhossiliensis]